MYLGSPSAMQKSRRIYPAETENVVCIYENTPGGDITGFQPLLGVRREMPKHRETSFPT